MVYIPDGNPAGSNIFVPTKFPVVDHVPAKPSGFTSSVVRSTSPPLLQSVSGRTLTNGQLQSLTTICTETTAGGHGDPASTPEVYWNVKVCGKVDKSELIIVEPPVIGIPVILVSTHVPPSVASTLIKSNRSNIIGSVPLSILHMKPFIAVMTGLAKIVIVCSENCKHTGGCPGLVNVNLTT